MRFHWLPLAFIGLLLLTGFFVPAVQAGTTTITITWSEFNAAKAVYAATYPGVKQGVTGNYTEWTVTVTHDCVFHPAANTSYYFGICIFNQDYTGDIPVTDFRFALHFYINGVKYIYNNGTDIVVSPVYTYVLPLTITYVNQTVTLKDANQTIANVTAFEPLSPYYILYKTRTMDTDTLISGSLTATIETPFPRVDVGLVMAWMPVILTFAMLSIVLSMLKKVGV